jgi:hypothetical protein
MHAVEEWLGLVAAEALLSVLIVGGAALLIAGVHLWRQAHRETRDLLRALLIARGFRRAIIGLCAMVFAVAALADVGWLMGLAAIVAGEETLESSVHVAALRDGVARAERDRSPSLPSALAAGR